MFNRHTREKHDVEYERAASKTDGEDYYDPETMGRRYTGVDEDASGNEPPRLNEVSQNKPFEYPDDDNDNPGGAGYGSRIRTSNQQEEGEIDDIMENVMDIHIINHPRDRARRKRVFVLVGTIVIATIILIVSLAASSDDDSSDSSSREKIGHPMTELNVVAPMNLPVLCSITSISTAIGHDECEQACEAARCCTAPGEASCFLEKEALCGTYSPCGTLHTETETPSQNDKDFIINNAVLIKDPQHPHGVEVSPPPSDLPFTCDPVSLQTPDEYLKCETACHHGSCCLATTTGPSLFDRGSCFATHPDLCGGYESCLNLDSVKPGPSGSEAVNIKCSRKNVATKEGRETCESLCAIRSCCFANDERNCRGTNKDWCNEYSACEVLVTEQDNDAGLSAPQKCQPQSLITQEDLILCENLCKPALCCYFGDSCSNTIKCHDFKFCDHVLSAYLSGVTWENSGGVTALEYNNNQNTGEHPSPIPPSNSGSVTSATYTGGSTTVPVTNTVTNTAANGGYYGQGASNNNQGYDTHGELDFEDSNLANEDKDIDNTFLQHKPLNSNSALEVLCSPENLMAYPGLCEMHCADHMCCFDTGVDGCANHPTCPSYLSCAMLLVDNYNTSPINEEPPSSTNAPVQHVKATPEEVQKRCASSNLVDVSGVHACMSVCDDYLCCFDDGPDACNTWSGCRNYQACKFISDNLKDDIQDAMTQVRDACAPANIESAGVDECKDLCKPYHCCTNGSCGGPECKIYSPICSVAFDDMDKEDEAVAVEEVFVEPPEDLNFRCGSDRKGTDRIQCDYPCKYALCCDESDAVKNCKETRPLMCKAYQACFQESYEDDYEDDESGEGAAVQNTQPKPLEVTGEGSADGVQSAQPGVQNSQPAPAVDTKPPVENSPPPAETVVSTGGSGVSSKTKDVTESCSEENKATKEGLEECKAACEKMSCCWDDDPSMNCFAQNSNLCLLYMSCPKNT